MTRESVAPLFEWGQAVVTAAASAGFVMPALPPSSDLKDFVAWARAVAPGLSGFVSLPPLGADDDYDAALGWARSLDGAARGMGADLPDLPRGSRPAPDESRPQEKPVQDRDALLSHYRRMRDQLLATIDGLTDDQMTERTIDGWSVKDHLLHMALWDEMRTLEVERISAGHDSALRMKPEQEESYNAMGYDLRRDMSLAQARWEVEKTRERLLAAIESATPRGLDSSLYGESALNSTHEAQHTGWIKRWRSEKGY